MMNSPQLVMPFAAAVSYAPEDYLEGAANQAALSLVQRWPDWPYAMVLIHGPKGSGKTHLAHVFAARTQATLIAPSRVGTATAEQILTGNHVWALDGIEAVKDPAALAQLMNLARARGDYLLLTASQPPVQLPVALPDLRSRLLALPCLGLGKPDDALLVGLLAKAFADRQIRVAPSILEFAVTHLERSYEAIQQFVSVMDKASLASGKPVTMALVRQVLQLAKTELG